MMDFLQSVIDKHKAAGVLIDSNLLLLLLAGLHDRSLVVRLKRLNASSLEESTP
ncbi:MAG TPA: hypothetical protein VGH07_06755 [Chthoniobacterales bacterium]|jgi:hypothetical protein